MGEYCLTVTLLCENVIVFEGGRTYHDVTNFKSESEGHNLYEFDSEWYGKITHVKIQGFIMIEEYPIDKSSKAQVLAKSCSMVSVCTHSGNREKFENVRNLTEDKVARIVEFDVDVNEKKGHMKMSGNIEKYIETFEE